MAGNITQDPEFKLLPSGRPLCKLRLAVNYKSKEYEEACFVSVDVFGRQAEICNQYLQKGKPVLVEGRLKYDTWQDKETGQTRNAHSIVASRVNILSLANQSQEGIHGEQEPASYGNDSATTNISTSSIRHSNSETKVRSSSQIVPATQTSGTPQIPHTTGRSVEDDIPF